MTWYVSPLEGKTTDWRAVCREIRKSGSEGGGDESKRRLLPLSIGIRGEAVLAPTRRPAYAERRAGTRPAPTKKRERECRNLKTS